MIVLLAFARTRLGMAVIGGLLIFAGAMVWLHMHNERILAEHDAAGAAQVRERENAALGGDRNLPANPDSVQSNDRWCRDCRK